MGNFRVARRLQWGDAEICARLERVVGGLPTYPKVGMIADTHFNIWRRGNRFFSHIEEMFDGFSSMCDSEGVDAVYVLGDLFDAKQTVTTDGLTRVNRMIGAMADRRPVVIVPGNHDMAYLDMADVNLASNYRRHENVVVIDRPVALEAFGGLQVFVPYSLDVRSVIADAAKLVGNAQGSHSLFGHFGVAGFKVHEYSSDFVNSQAAQVAVQDLSAFDRVFLGHYHGYQSSGNVTYVSAPLQSRHGDEASMHGFVAFDYATGGHKFHDNPSTPRFVTYELTKENAQRMLGLRNHYIRIKVTKKVSKDLLVALRRRLMKSNFEVKIDADLPNEAKFAAMKGWKDIKFHDAESLIVAYLRGLEDTGELKYDRARLLSHIGISEE